MHEYIPDLFEATKQGTYRPDSIFVGDMTPELLDSYIEWRREIKQNSDATINHSLTPILKACAYACEMTSWSRL